MAVRDILQIGHPVLAARAAEVDPRRIASDEVQGWIDDMIDTMRAANGAGIAANQIGIPYRLTVGPKSLADGEVEWTSRSTGDTKRIGLTAAVDTVVDLVNTDRNR